MVQKCFCTPDRPMDPTFQTRYTQQICVQFDGDTDHKTNPTFFEAPCMSFTIEHPVCPV